MKQQRQASPSKTYSQPISQPHTSYLAGNMFALCLLLISMSTAWLIYRKRFVQALVMVGGCGVGAVILNGGGLAVAGIAIVLLCMCLQFVSETENIQDTSATTVLSIRRTFLLYVSQGTLWLAIMLVGLIELETRVLFLTQHFKMLGRLFEAPTTCQESLEVDTKIDNPITSEVTSPTFGPSKDHFGGASMRSPDQSEMLPSYHPTNKKTSFVSEELSQVIKAPQEQMPLLSQTSDPELIQFGTSAYDLVQVEPPPMLGSAQDGSAPECLRECSFQNFCCDEMIRLTKKSFQFFREVVVSLKNEGILIVVKNSNVGKGKVLSSFEVRRVTEQILEVGSSQSCRFLRFQSAEGMEAFLMELGRKG